MKDQFRLLGIKTGERVKLISDNTNKKKDLITDEKDFLRILSENTYYPFYSCYRFVEGEFTYFPEEDIDLYNKSENKLNIQVSAIVGKNGTGKSTLLELLYLANYNLGCACGLLSTWEYDKNLKEEIEIKSSPKKLNLEIYFEKNKIVYRLEFKETSIQLFTEKSRKKNVLHFIIDDDFINKETKIPSLSTLFYSIAINYSIYGLNSEISGKWVKPLFHKNDGYKTPLVINPMRTKGDFDINDEMEFATYRLVSNILIQRKLQKKNDTHVFVTDKQHVTSIKFKLNAKKIAKNRTKIYDDFFINRAKYLLPDLYKNVIDDFITTNKDFFKKDSNYQDFFNSHENELRVILSLYKEFYIDNSLINKHLYHLPFRGFIIDYIVRKINKILRTYVEYESFIVNGKDGIKCFDFDRIFEFSRTIKTDNSHITFKLKQALNFLRNELSISKKGEKSKWESVNETNSNCFTPQELLDWMQTDKIEEIIQHIPPSIFDIEIGLSDGFNIADSASHFGDLSSGEQQLIHSVNTVLYHINNLQSAHFSNDGRLAYEDINVIFDEVELYFHPEYQRKFINFLIDSVNRLPLTKTEDNKGLKSINFLFSTHSPFILSDIPKQNILTLSISDETRKAIPIKILDQTFGGNIHDLLANSFFLDKGYVGEKAVKIINDVIVKLNDWLDKRDKEVNNEEKFHVKTVIGLIGNELVKGKLSEMYMERFDDQDFRETLAQEYELKAKKLRGHD